MFDLEDFFMPNALPDTSLKGFISPSQNSLDSKCVKHYAKEQPTKERHLMMDIVEHLADKVTTVEGPQELVEIKNRTKRE